MIRFYKNLHLSVDVNEVIAITHNQISLLAFEALIYICNFPTPIKIVFNNIYISEFNQLLFDFLNSQNNSKEIGYSLTPNFVITDEYFDKKDEEEKQEIK